jgi:hypothetical protein
MTSMMFAPFDPDPECPWCNGRGFKHIVDDQVDVVGRCDCTNWSTYAELRHLKGFLALPVKRISASISLSIFGVPMPCCPKA